MARKMPVFRALFIGLMMASCAVGPDFKPQQAPKVTGYTAEPLTEKTVSADVAGGQAQSFLQGEDIPAQWWTLFHSKPLNQLVEKALKANPGLEAAKAALLQAQENVYAAKGVFFPSLDAKGLALRQKTSGALFGSASGGSSKFNLFNASVDVAYVFDI
ncbi:MAG: TolC family protein, partial [Mariprofundaceae bacterium]|nr:TolC family protein [Mariprofundaceae bacterium]